jgi:tRNA 2-thiouridine synthesizing protein A
LAIAMDFHAISKRRLGRGANAGVLHIGCVYQRSAGGDVINVTGTNEIMLNLRGLRCPQPVLRAKKALRDVPVGGVLVLECTDPLTVIDVPHFVNQTGHALQAQERNGKLYIFRIVKQH